MRLDREKYRQDIRLFSPSEDPATPLLTERPAEKLADDSRFMLAAVQSNETQRSGIYEMWFSRVDGSIDADRFAVNVNPREGDLAQTPTSRHRDQPGPRAPSKSVTPTNTKPPPSKKLVSIRACC